MSVNSRSHVVATCFLLVWQMRAAELEVLSERGGQRHFRQDVWIKDGSLSNDEVDQYLRRIMERTGHPQLVQIRFYGDPRERWGRAGSPHMPYSLLLQNAKAPQLSVISEVLMMGDSGVQRTWSPDRRMVMRLLGNRDPLSIRTSAPPRTFRLVFLQFWSDDRDWRPGAPEALEVFLTGGTVPSTREGEGLFRELKRRFPAGMLSISVATEPWFPFSMYFPVPFPLSPVQPPTAAEYSSWPKLQCDDYNGRAICVGGGNLK